LLDRANDCLTPLMHDVRYQCMVHDVLKVEDDRITYQSEKPSDPTQTEPKDALLDERDALWVELRGLHIDAVRETLSIRLNEIANSSTGSALGKKKESNAMSLSQMSSVLKDLPEYREVTSKLAQHFHLVIECLNTYKSKLVNINMLEQTLATGKDEDGRAPKLSDIMDKVEEALLKMKDSKSRLRMILLATISQGGLRQEDRRRLLNAADLSRKETRTLNALEVMGVSIFASADKKSIVSMFTG
jgi:syntaxin-binding protein 1